MLPSASLLLRLGARADSPCIPWGFLEMQNCRTTQSLQFKTPFERPSRPTKVMAHDFYEVSVDSLKLSSWITPTPRIEHDALESSMSPPY